MLYKDCIRATMTIIHHLLDSGEYIYNSDSNSLNCMRLGLNEKGFVLEEESRLGCQFLYGANQIPLSPSSVLSVFFAGGFDYKHKNFRTHAITEMSKKIPRRKLQKPISYIKLVQLLEDMRNRHYKDGTTTPTTIDIEYARFRQFLKEIDMDTYPSLKNEIIDIENLSYMSLINIRETQPTTARKIEQMYQIEVLLEKYCKERILLENKPDEIECYEEKEFSRMIDTIDLSKVEVDWIMFCEIVKESNFFQIMKDNKYWKENRNNPSTRPTIFGLEEMANPGTPNVYKKKRQEVR
ncbi:MAG: hypothetical protein PHN72_05500 [Bacilli bacterium]|nr:hypothetical protein [Bacilli bacterium]